MTPDFYPNAVQRPLTGHSYPGVVAQRRLIVPHITQGWDVDGAWETFEQSVHPNRVSAHFIIDRSGTIFQLLPLSDTAFHASQVNFTSIGIEHVAYAGVNTATDQQYTASAKLCVWLCQQLGIPIDNEHIKGHNAASPADGHVLCCEGALSCAKLVALAQAIPAPSDDIQQIPT